MLAAVWTRTAVSTTDGSVCATTLMMPSPTANSVGCNTPSWSQNLHNGARLFINFVRSASQRCVLHFIFYENLAVTSIESRLSLPRLLAAARNCETTFWLLWIVSSAYRRSRRKSRSKHVCEPCMLFAGGLSCFVHLWAGCCVTHSQRQILICFTVYLP